MQEDSPEIIERIPSVDDYLRIRVNAGLSPFPRAAAEAGLPNSIVGVAVLVNGETVGIGRVIGDGGLFFQLVDIAVEPAFQGRGLGKQIVAKLLSLLSARIPARAYVSLIADGEAHRLYSQFGFEPVAPGSIGMSRWLQPPDGQSV